MSTNVNFLVRDVIHPHPVEVLVELFQDCPLQGDVIATTNDGRESNTYLVVRVPNLSEPVIIPVRAARAHPQPDAELVLAPKAEPTPVPSGGGPQL